jgi:hypothetical protein
MQDMYVEQSPRCAMQAAPLSGGNSEWARNMTTTVSDSDHDKRTRGRLPPRHGFRRIESNNIARIVARRVGAELQARPGQVAAARPLPATAIGTGVLAGVALVLSVMTWLNEATHDKPDKATAPLATRMTEIDRRFTDRFDAADARMERIETRIDRLEARYEKEFETVNTKLDLLLKRR